MVDFANSQIFVAIRGTHTRFYTAAPQWLARFPEHKKAGCFPKTGIGHNGLRCARLVLGALLIALAFVGLTVACDQAMAHLGAGLKQFHLQRYDEAAKEFSLAVRSDPHLLDARYHLAVAYFEGHEFGKARNQFDQLKPMGYEKLWVTYYLARIDLRDGKLESAIRRFESLQRGQPLRDELYYLGSAFLRKGDAQEAAKFLRQETAFNPRDFRAHYLLGRIYLKLGERQQAQREFDESDRLHEYYARGKQDFTECREQLQSGHGKAAWSRCGRSALGTNDIDRLVAVGMLFGEFSDYNHAALALEKALTLNPQSPEINYDLGYTYYEMNDYSRAAKYSHVAVERSPYFFPALEVCGMSLYKLGKDMAGKSVLLRAHELRPDDKTVMEALARINGLPAR